MPHFRIEYSRDVEERHDIGDAVKNAFAAGVKTGEMTADALKVRATPYDHHMINVDGGSFVHMTVYLLEGRTVEQKDKIGNILLESLSESFSTVTSVSIDFRDMEAAAYKKRVL
ncbi:5-carboxymethyl-2-hydroxymuconate Delta-isomerase [Curvivirga aplysinae]|uniref:5-carboxymethyl-2-hydroxymuconate Delta-isomerase n=1 Tax=Curvivirga aplysinae TaxID=2529852 RepID=UPI0012BCEB78|nr:5-carboxymethyl-2-hydroxymuconate isomerase [Curvivirga aplysinae]MTI10472.1 5-carboxymethyl-2-hydroxymuconate isomerase [Curvivirga aplysinae]